jgi:hypothetical protein
MKQYGHGKGTIHGGCSEFTIVPAKYAYLLKTNIDDQSAAMMERELHHVLLYHYPCMRRKVGC